AAAAEVVLVSLADDAAVTATYGGPEGLVAGLRPGTVVLEMSTIAPETARQVGRLVAERDAVLLDAPVSGSVPSIRQGQLTVLAGGDAAAPFVQYKKEAFLHPDQAPVAFALELVAKDLDLIAALARQVGARADLATTVRDTVGEAVEAGLGDADMSGLASFLRRPPPAST